MGCCCWCGRLFSFNSTWLKSGQTDSIIMGGHSVGEILVWVLWVSGIAVRLYGMICMILVLCFFGCGVFIYLIVYLLMSE